MPDEDWDVDRFDGTDGTGAIRVTVDRSGMMTDVVIAPSWREKVRPDELGSALCTAANEALNSRLADEFEHLTCEPEVTTTVRQDARDALGSPSGPVAQDLRTEIANLLVFIKRDLETYRDQLSQAIDATASARGTKGAIEVTMGHGQVTDVTVNPGWAKSARRASVRAEALRAFTVAARQLATADPRAVTPPASIVRLRELSGDPPALTRELGLS